MKIVETDTAAGFQRIYKHQAVLVLTDRPGKSWKGIILTPGKTQSLIRYNEENVLREKRIDNLKLLPVKIAQPRKFSNGAE